MSKRNSQFGKYLNKNINLITILGIFNGLSIYSSSLEEESGAYIVGFVFTFLSVLVIRELILQIPKKEGLELPLLSLLLGTVAVWLSLIYILFKKYSSASSMTTSLLFIGWAMYFVIDALKNKFFSKLKQTKPKVYNIVSVILFFATLIGALIIWGCFFEFVSNLTTPNLPVNPKKITY